MEQYIPKAPIVAEIDSIAADAICQYNSDKSRYAEGVIDVIHRIKHFLKTLEVADVDVIKRNWYNQGYLRGRREANIPTRELGLPKSCDFQQEQPKVDLEKEFADFLEKENAYVNDNSVISYYNGDSFNHTYDIYPIARHFFELGLKAQKG